MMTILKAIGTKQLDGKWTITKTQWMKYPNNDYINLYENRAKKYLSNTRKRTYKQKYNL